MKRLFVMCLTTIVFTAFWCTTVFAAEELYTDTGEPSKTILIETEGQPITRGLFVNDHTVTFDILWTVSSSGWIRADMQQFTSPATTYFKMWCSQTMQQPNGSIVSGGSATMMYCTNFFWKDGKHFTSRGPYTCYGQFSGWLSALSMTYTHRKTESRTY